MKLTSQACSPGFRKMSQDNTVSALLSQDFIQRNAIPQHTEPVGLKSHSNFQRLFKEIPDSAAKSEPMFCMLLTTFHLL